MCTKWAAQTFMKDVQLSICKEHEKKKLWYPSRSKISFVHSQEKVIVITKDLNAKSLLKERKKKNGWAILKFIKWSDDLRKLLLTF